MSLMRECVSNIERMEVAPDWVHGQFPTRAVVQMCIIVGWTMATSFAVWFVRKLGAAASVGHFWTSLFYACAVFGSLGALAWPFDCAVLAVVYASEGFVAMPIVCMCITVGWLVCSIDNLTAIRDMAVKAWRRRKRGALLAIAYVVVATAACVCVNAGFV